MYAFGLLIDSIREKETSNKWKHSGHKILVLVGDSDNGDVDGVRTKYGLLDISTHTHTYIVYGSFAQ